MSVLYYLHTDARSGSQAVLPLETLWCQVPVVTEALAHDHPQAELTVLRPGGRLSSRTSAAHAGQMCVSGCELMARTRNGCSRLAGGTRRLTGSGLAHLTEPRRSWAANPVLTRSKPTAWVGRAQFCATRRRQRAASIAAPVTASVPVWLTRAGQRASGPAVGGPRGLASRSIAVTGRGRAEPQLASSPASCPCPLPAGVPGGC